MPRKGENIYKRKDGRWEGRYIKKKKSATEKTSYGYVYARTYHDLKRKLQDAVLHSETDAAMRVENADLFASAAMEWFENIKPQIKESTRNKYWNLLNSYILPLFGKQPLKGITYEFIEKQCRELLSSGGKKGTGLSTKTVAGILSIVRSILRFAIRNGKSVPCDGNAVQIKQAPKEIRVLSRKEQEKLCEYLYSEPNSFHIGILVCLFTGLMLGEICALRWEDISLSDRTLHVRHTMQRIQDRSGTGKKTKIVVTEPKSNCSIRTIPIPDVLLQVLKEYQTASTGYLLTNSDTRFVEPRTMQNHFKRALKKCGIANANFHVTRHSFATRCIEVGFDVKSLSEILGHSTVTITMNRYVHPALELKMENMQKLSSLFAVI